MGDITLYVLETSMTILHTSIPMCLLFSTSLNVTSLTGPLYNVVKNYLLEQKLILFEKNINKEYISFKSLEVFSKSL